MAAFDLVIKLGLGLVQSGEQLTRLGLGKG